MNYPTTIDFLYKHLPAYHRIGPSAFKKDLTNIKILCEYLGNPQESFKTVHIAGTNGKGSTAHMLAAIFQSAGYSTGLYTSPHLIDFRERIKLNGEFIHKNSVIQLVKKIQPLLRDLQPSFFELTVAMAYYYFAIKKVDIAIVETGLGGRLDSTNIIYPIISIITNISLEHQQFLGDTLPEIAREKAGIIKPNVPVVIGSTLNDTTPIFKEVANINSAPLYFAENMFHTTKIKHHINYTNYCYSNIYDNNTIDFNCELKGAYQSKNITLVLASINIINRSSEFKINPKAIQNGMESVVKLTQFKGRWQTLRINPKIIVDCAHNAAGIQVAIQNLSVEKYDQLRIVFGCVKDKDLDKIVEFLPTSAKYYLTQPSVERALPIAQTLAFFESNNFQIIAYSDIPKDMLLKATSDSNINDLILVFGSIFLVADILIT